MPPPAVQPDGVLEKEDVPPVNGSEAAAQQTPKQVTEELPVLLANAHPPVA